MKVTRASEAKKYEALGHYDVRTLRLHNAAEVEDGKITLGISHFLPEGGAEFGKAPAELLYYIISGEMTITTEKEKFVLKAGDSIHFAAGEGREPKNNSVLPATMLVVLVK